MATHCIGCVFPLQFSGFVFKKFVVFLNQTGLSIKVYLIASKRKEGRSHCSCIPLLNQLGLFSRSTTGTKLITGNDCD